MYLQSTFLGVGTAGQRAGGPRVGPETGRVAEPWDALARYSRLVTLGPPMATVTTPIAPTVER